MADTRTERDSMGEMVVPANAYYGAQTARAVENFPISGLRFPRSFIAALGTIKGACARVNAALGLLDQRLADAIGRAAAEVAEGKLDGEVMRPLLPALEELAAAFEERARAFADVVKAGRTHLQDAVPMTLGQEFGGYASVVRHGIARVKATLRHLAELPIGGTALGTGLNAPPGFGEKVTAELARRTGLRFVPAPDRFEAMQNRDAAVETSGALRTLAVGLMKIANDLRLLTSGARTGLNEIELPATQPGSSIMPGKVNPVIPEAVNQVAALVIGHDATIAIAGMNGNLDLNVMMPVIAHALLESIAITAAAARVFSAKCVCGIRANVERCRQYAELTGQLVTAIAPVVGYDRAAEIYKKAVARDLPIRQVLADDGVLPPAEIDRLLDLHALARGGRAGSR